VSFDILGMRKLESWLQVQNLCDLEVNRQTWFGIVNNETVKINKESIGMEVKEREFFRKYIFSLHHTYKKYSIWYT
jgi:hypothetical protein